MMLWWLALALAASVFAEICADLVADDGAYVYVLGDLGDCPVVFDVVDGELDIEGVLLFDGAS